MKDIPKEKVYLLSLKKKIAWLKENNGLFINDNKFEEENFASLIDSILRPIALKQKGNHSIPSLYVYTNGYYQNNGYQIINHLAQRSNGHLVSSTKINKINYAMQGLTIEERNYFDDVDPYLLPVQNGVLDLRTKKLHKHHPKFRNTFLLPVHYDPEVDYTWFNEELDAVLKPNAKKNFQEFYGDCLHRTYKYQKMIILYGPGGNGKDTFIYPLLKILEGNYSTANMYNICYNDFTAAQLHQKYLNYSSENPSKNIRTWNMIKALTGDSPIQAQHKHQQPFDFWNFAKLAFSLNELPEVLGNTDALWDRILTIDFLERIRGTKKDIKNYKKTLADTEKKKSAILNFALEGFDRLEENNGYTNIPLNRAKKKLWDERVDSVKSFMIEIIKKRMGSSVEKEEIFETYVDFCNDIGVSHRTRGGFWKIFWRYSKKMVPNTFEKPINNNKKRLIMNIELISDRKKSPKIKKWSIKEKGKFSSKADFKIRNEDD